TLNSTSHLNSLIQQQHQSSQIMSCVKSSSNSHSHSQQQNKLLQTSQLLISFSNLFQISSTCRFHIEDEEITHLAIDSHLKTFLHLSAHQDVFFFLLLLFYSL